MAQTLGHIGAHVIAQILGVATGRPQQPLHRLRATMTSMLGQPTRQFVRSIGANSPCTNAPP
jgi:hypothetical protein